jgi:hypothetical protein
MRKIFTLLSFVSITAFGYSQSLRLYVGSTDVTNTTITINVTTNSYNENDLDIHNISSNTISILTKRTIVNSPLGSTCAVSFCTGGQCYSTDGSIKVYTQRQEDATPLDGMTDLIGVNGLAAHFDVDSTCCGKDTYIQYNIYDKDASGDSAKVTFHYVCTASGIDDVEKRTEVISNAYPNPSNSIASINYDVTDFSQKGKIVFYDVLGKVLKEIALTDKKGIAKVNIEAFDAGIYFYTLIVDGKAINTKKLVVSEK